MGSNRYFEPELECASREKLSQIQSEGLVKLVKANYDKVPAMRKKMDAAGVEPGDIKTIEDIAKLPFTEKTDLRDNYPYGLFAVDRKELVRIHASSGTTGKQTVVGYTAQDVANWTKGSARSLVAAGATEEDMVHVSYGYGLFTGGLGLHYGVEMINAVAILLSVQVIPADKFRYYKILVRISSVALLPMLF